MADLYKCTWFFEYGRGGYSVSHWIQKDGYNDARTAAVALGKGMLGLSGTGVHLPYIRISREDIKGDSIVYTTDLVSGNAPPVVGAPKVAPSVTTIPTAISDTPDAWWTAVLLRLGNSPTQWGHQFLRGVPDSLDIFPDGSASDPAWQKALDKWFTNLEKDGWGMMGIPKGPGTRKKVGQWGKAGPNAFIVCTTDGAHGFNDATVIKIGGVKPPSGILSGTWKISVTGANTFMLIGSEDATLPAPLLDNGEVWATNKQFFAYKADFCVSIRVTERRAGRPFDVLRGRVKRKA